jgi:hypothetical protein
LPPTSCQELCAEFLSRSTTTTTNVARCLTTTAKPLLPGQLLIPPTPPLPLCSVTCHLVSIGARPLSPAYIQPSSSLLGMTTCACSMGDSLSARVYNLATRPALDHRACQPPPFDLRCFSWQPHRFSFRRLQLCSIFGCASFGLVVAKTLSMFLIDSLCENLSEQVSEQLGSDDSFALTWIQLIIQSTSIACFNSIKVVLGG